MTPAALAPGCILGRYEILAPIASGGMAEVWAARLHGTRGFQRLVALKTISQKTTDDARMEQMFLQEASLASRIQHPNVAATLDLGEQDGVLYMVMEWVDGEPLSVVFERAYAHRPIPLAVAVNLIGQACQGLHTAHELSDDDGTPLGIVHRDVSPHNVMVTHAGIVKLVDFGIAKATNVVTGRTEAGEVKGKFAYMAPEQVRGETIDRRADIFALGILLYLLTTGRHPHRAATPAETIHRLCTETPARPSELFANYPRSLEAIVMKALAKDRHSRFASARELFDALALTLPRAFQAGFESNVAEYLEQLIGALGSESKARLRLAQRSLDGIHKGSTTAPGSADPASATSLRALVVDAGAPSAQVASASETRGTLVSSSSSGLRPPSAPRLRARARVLPLLTAALAVAAVAAFIVPRWSRWNGNHSAGRAPAPAMTAGRALEPPTTSPPIAPPIAPPPSASASPERANASAAPAPPLTSAKARPSDSVRRVRHPPARIKNSAVTKSTPTDNIATPPPSAPPSPTQDLLQKRY